MSEFECANGHLSRAGLKCSKCGARITRMDGMSRRELMAEESLEDIRDYEYLRDSEDADYPAHLE